MSYITLQEKVPPKYCRLFMFFGEDDFKGIICVDGAMGGNRMFIGTHDTGGDGKNDGNYMDWQQAVIEKIRAELKAMEMFPGSEME